MTGWVRALQSALDRSVLRRLVPRRYRSKRRQFVRSLSLGSDAPACARSNEEWKRLRKRTALEAKKSLEQGSPILAVRRLTRALLEDPACPLYLDLMRQAVALKHRRKAGAERGDRLAAYPAELREATLQLEAFIAYVHEVEGLLSKASLVAHAPLPPRGSKS